jgi:hypothetical protein
VREFLYGTVICGYYTDRVRIVLKSCKGYVSDYMYYVKVNDKRLEPKWLLAYEDAYDLFWKMVKNNEANAKKAARRNRTKELGECGVATDDVCGA